MLAPIIPVNLPLAVQVSNRSLDGLKDGRLINGYMEKRMDGAGTDVFKRPGSSLVLPLSPTGIPMGFHLSEIGFYSVVSNEMYNAQTGAAIGSVTGSGVNNRTSFVDYTTGTFIQSGDGLHFYYYAGGTYNAATPVADNYVPGPVYLDGTIYIMSVGGAIRGSGINDPTTWDPLNVIQTANTSDFGICLVKQKVYVIALKQLSTSVFFDNGNATGSPLSPLPGGQSSVGCVSPNGVQVMGDEVVWLGQSSGGGYGVFLMRDLKITKVSIPGIDRMITKELNVLNGVGTSLSWQMWCPGHRFYVLNLQGIGISVVYDLENGMWYEWFDNLSAAEPYATGLQGYTASTPYAQFSNGQIHQFTIDQYSDVNGSINWTLQTDPYDGGNRYWKYLERLDLIADQYNPSLMTVSYTEDDYQTFSNPRTMDLSMNRPNLVKCGRFQKRAYKFEHNFNSPLRVQNVVASIQQGNY